MEKHKKVMTIINLKYLDDVFELPDGLYSISDNQDYFEYIKKKNEKNIDNPLVRIYVNKIENRITFKIKAGYYPELLTREAMKLPGNTEDKTTKYKNGGSVAH